MILPDKSPERTEIVLLFRVDDPEQAATLHNYRAAFAGASEIEAVTETVFALHVRPGVCACGDAA